MTDSIGPFVNQLLGQMSLEERSGQMNQLNGGDQLGLEWIRQGKTGSLIDASSALNGQDLSDSSSAEQRNFIQRPKSPLILGAM